MPSRMTTEVRQALRKFLQDHGESPANSGRGEPATPPDDWQAFALETVRYAGGQGEWSEEQQRLIKLDVLEGMIRLGTAQGRDVRVLQELQREMRESAGLSGARGSAAPVGNGTGRGGGAIRPADVLELYRAEIALARERTAGMAPLARAAELDAEEARARRQSLGVPVLSDEEAWRIGAAIAEADETLRGLRTTPPGTPPERRGPPPGDEPPAPGPRP